ncbi:MAG TPA: YfhO family protein, partial [Bryobacteraceae bacterium]|nr:YfhO family protein [Bryobacteraceae bacterium]
MIERLKTKLDLRRAPAIFCVILLVFQPVWFYWRTVIGLRSHIPYDIEGYHFPQIAYLAQCLGKGVFPLWDPYSYAGMPIHADMQAQLFYPPTWIVMLLGNLRPYYFYYWIEWMDPVHMMLAGVTTFLLLRRMELRPAPALLGASVFELGGFFASQAQHLCAICCAAWLPLALLAVHESRHKFSRRWTAIFALSIAMSVLAGFAAATIAVAFAVILFAVTLIAMRESSWRIFRSLVPGFIWAALIAAVILIPASTLTQLSMASHRYLWLAGSGLPLESLVSLVHPNHYHIFDLEHYKLPFNATFLYIYCGLVPVFLIALALLTMRRRPALFLAATAVVTILMLGMSTPVYASLFPHLPDFLRSVLYPEYGLLAFSFFAGVTAACELDHFASRLPHLFIWALVLFTSWDLVHTGSKRPMNTYPGGPRQHDRQDLEDT